MKYKLNKLSSLSSPLTRVLTSEQQIEGVIVFVVDDVEMSAIAYERTCDIVRLLFAGHLQRCFRFLVHFPQCGEIFPRVVVATRVNVAIVLNILVEKSCTVSKGGQMRKCPAVSAFYSRFERPFASKSVQYERLDRVVPLDGAIQPMDKQRVDTVDIEVGTALYQRFYKCVSILNVLARVPTTIPRRHLIVDIIQKQLQRSLAVAVDGVRVGAFFKEQFAKKTIRLRGNDV